MGLADDLLQAGKKAKQGGCTLARLYATLDPKDADALREAVDGQVVTHAELARILTANGHRVGTSTIGRHRNRGCACGAS